jgi:hypothetical protein
VNYEERPIPLSDMDVGLAWPIKADGQTFLEDVVLCGASLKGARTCILPLNDQLECPDHGKRRLP